LRPIVLTIAGSDPSAGAGVQADLKAIEACGGYAATAITALTVQNTRGVTRIEPVPPDLLRDQIVAVLDDLDVAAVKTGMLPDAATVLTIAALLGDRTELPLITDPLLASSGGFALGTTDLRVALLEHLVPRATLITPNADEARVLTGLPVEDPAQAQRAGEALLRGGARAVLVKGGHLLRDRGTDVLVGAKGTRRFAGEWIDSPHTHGGGCVYSAAIAAGIAAGCELEQAIEEARAYLTEAIRHGLPLGRGNGPTDPFFGLQPQSRRALPGAAESR